MYPNTPTRDMKVKPTVHSAGTYRSPSDAKVSELDTDWSLVHYKLIPHQRRINSCSGLAVIVNDHIPDARFRVFNPPDMLPSSLLSLL
jgi:hypothetical protein